MGTYLVTGAAGFIGAALAKRLLDEKNDVVVIDNLSTGDERNIPEGCIKIIGDTYDEEVIKKLYEYDFDAIFHIAGQSGGMPSYEDPIYDLKSNSQSTVMLLDYCRKTDCKKLIFASTMAVYGDPDVFPVTEKTTSKPKSFYAVGKNSSENYMRIYTQFGIKSTALRFNNVYGPGQNMKNLKQGMASIFLAQALAYKRVHVMGSKDRFRDFVYVDDVVNACCMALEGQEEELFNAYNVATNVKTTCEELIGIIKKYLPYEIQVEYSGNTPGDQFGMLCSYDKIRMSLGWEPHVNIEDGMKAMVEWGLKLDKDKLPN